MKLLLLILIVLLTKISYSQNCHGSKVDIVPNQILAINEDINGIIWISSSLGVYKFNRLSLDKDKWFDGKADVINILRNNRSLLLFHSDLTITIIKEEFHQTIETPNIILDSFDFIYKIHYIDNSEYPFVKILAECHSDLNKKNVLLTYRCEEVLILDKVKYYNVDARHDIDHSFLSYKNDSLGEMQNIKIINVNKVKWGDEKGIKVLNINDTFLKVEILPLGINLELEIYGVITGVLIDYENNIWISTLNNGLWEYEINLYNKLFSEIIEVDISSQILIDTGLYFSKRYGFNERKKRSPYTIIYENQQIVGCIGNYNYLAFKVGYNAFYLKGKYIKLKTKINDIELYKTNLYMATNEGIYIYDINSKKLLKKIFSGFNIQTISTSNHYLYFFVENTIYKINFDNYEVIEVIQFTDNIWTFIIHDNWIIYSSNVGIYTYNISDRKVTKISTLKEVTRLYYNKNILWYSDNRYIYYKEGFNSANSNKPRFQIFFDGKLLTNRKIKVYNPEETFEFGIATNYASNECLFISIYDITNSINKKYYSYDSFKLPKLEPGNYFISIALLNNIGYMSKSKVFDLCISATRSNDKYSNNIYISYLFIFSLSFVELIYYLLVRKNDYNRLVQENEFMKIQLNKIQLSPHFLFNVINSVKGLAYSGDKMKTNLYIDQVATFLRDSLNNNLTSTIEEELRVLNNYFTMEKQRLQHRLLINKEINEDVLQMIIPANILQPIVENSIKYSAKNEIIIIDIKVSIIEGFLKIRIEDNGPGVEDNVNANSFSLNSIFSRIKHFNDDIINDELDIDHLKVSNRISKLSNDSEEITGAIAEMIICYKKASKT